ncbi:MAG: heme A synthase [Nitrospinae bacterium]|nr:heme A synthase [Nitrospinota bacterium]
MNKILIGLSIAFTYILMVVGNVVTTTGSGLGCPDWPLCYGTVVPPLQIQTWIEWSHRLLGGATGLFILGATVSVWLTAKGPVRALTMSALGLLGVGAVFGGVIVMLEAPLLEGVLHIMVISFHIIVATAIFILMILAYRRLDTAPAAKENSVYTVMFAIILLQVILGIFVRYSQAAMACSAEFPLCNGQVIPEFAEPGIALHFVHRLMAYVVFFFTGGYMIKAIKDKSDVANSVITFSLVVAQGAVGIGIVHSGMFLPLIVGHGAFGFLLLGWVAYRSAPGLLGFNMLVQEEARA